MKFFSILIFYLVFFSKSYSIEVQKDLQKSSLQIIPSKQILKYENEFYIGIKIILDKGWKTYWKNPGDAGLPVKLRWSSKENIKKYEILYPFPKKYIDHGVLTIGYENEIIFPIKIEFNPEIRFFESNLTIEYLVCNEICIPMSTQRKIKLDLKNNFKNLKDSIVYKYLKQVPSSNSGFYKLEYVSSDSNSFLFIFNNKDLDQKKLKAFVFDKEQTQNIYTDIFKDENKVYLKVFSDSDFENPSKKIFLSLSDQENIEELEIKLEKSRSTNGLIIYIFLAILGGILLNFMPCVLPVLSLKVYSFIQLKEKNTTIVKRNCLAIILGIIFSFLLLALIIILLKLFGNQVGWGFQFQNYYFLIFLALIILVFAMNLLGFFEIILPGKFLNFINSKSSKDNFQTNFLSGLFATLLATPCSAPFLGTAVGFSMLASNLTIIIIFVSISIGFAFPYFLLLTFPSLTKFLPKPGEWIENFKFFMGILLILTFSWLLTLLGLNLKVIFSFISIIIISSIFMRKNYFKITISILLISILLIFFIFPKQEEDIMWAEFDKEKLNNYLNNNNLIFLDFTADWCVTCQFNKIATLKSDEVIKFFLTNEIKLLRADWTNKDSDILNFMTSFNRFGIPLNIIYGPKNKEGIVLPEILTKDIVIDGLDELK